MNKNRLEAFSDGVLAIVITLLVLDIRIPHVENGNIVSVLRDVLPNIASYIMSFAIIGVYWVGHHYYFTFIKRTNGVFTWLNLLFLLMVSFIPFPTSLLGEYPFQTIPIIIYGANLVAVNIVSLLMIIYIYRNRHLANEILNKRLLKEFIKIFVLINVTYLVAIGISPFTPRASYGIYIVALVALLILYSTRRDLQPDDTKTLERQ